MNRLCGANRFQLPIFQSIILLGHLLRHSRCRLYKWSTTAGWRDLQHCYSSSIYLTTTAMDFCFFQESRATQSVGIGRPKRFCIRYLVVSETKLLWIISGTYSLLHKQPGYRKIFKKLWLFSYVPAYFCHNCYSYSFLVPSQIKYWCSPFHDNPPWIYSTKKRFEFICGQPLHSFLDRLYII